jgi:sugar/nucleoside kinase (ribokinase family)
VATPPSASPEIVCIGSIFIDDIVFPDGRTVMEVLGGGGVHAAAGVLTWGERPGLVSCAGKDIPASALRRLERDFDLQGLVHLELPQARAWQIFEWDGRRTEIYRMKIMQPYLEDPQPEALAESYRRARGVSILRGSESFLLWRDALPDAVLLWEPSQDFMQPHNSEAFFKALPAADIVSPNLVEARLVSGDLEPEALIALMLERGAKIVVLRMGEAGSLVGAREWSTPLLVPPVPVETIVDQTGAGNTYCGGFLAGWVKTGDLQTAACYGAVAASFALEVIGVAHPDGSDFSVERDRRLQWLRQQLRL